MASTTSNPLHNKTVSALYNQHTQSMFTEYKTQFSSEQKLKQHSLYFKKCLNELNAIELSSKATQYDTLATSIQTRLEHINKTKQILSSIPSTPVIQVSPFLSANTSLKTEITSLLSHIDKLDLDNPVDSIKKAKNEFEHKNNSLFFQPLITTLIRLQRDYEMYFVEKQTLLKEKAEKLATAEENKHKIQKLTEEYNSNSERMTNELNVNAQLQKEIHELNMQLLSEENGVTKGNDERIEKVKGDVERGFMQVSEVNAKVRMEENEGKKALEEVVKMVMKMWYVMRMKRKMERSVKGMEGKVKEVVGEVKECVGKIKEKVEWGRKLKKEEMEVSKRVMKYENIIKLI